MDNEPMVLCSGALDIQVCVPGDWSDAQVIEFVTNHTPSGTEAGWHIRKQGHPMLDGYDERESCEQRTGFVHIMLDC